MRLFFGLSLPDEVRRVTDSAAQSAAAHIPGRYAPASNHHITLAFIGEVEEARLDDARNVLAQCAARFAAPRVALGGYSHFGRAQNGILILSAKSDPPLEPIHIALKEALAAAGLPFDPGPFSPHVTLARHADVSAGYPPAPSPCAFTAHDAHLFLSARDENNVLRYTPIASFPFLNPPI